MQKKLISKIDSTPNLFPYEVDINNNKIIFRLMTRKDYRNSFFILSPGKGPGFLKGSNSFSMSLSDVIEIFKEKKYINQSSIIYNHGFCCSTLLTRMLEESFKVLALKEPPLLNSLVHYLKNNNDADIKNTFLSLHNRTFNQKEKALWKPSDYSFDLIEETQILKIPSIYLYSPLNEYIASCSKEKRRDWIANRADFKKLKELLNIKIKDLDLEKTSIQATLYWCYFAHKYILLSKNSSNLTAVNSNSILNNPNLVDKIGNHLKLHKKFNIFKKRNTTKLMNTYAKTDSYEYNAEIRSNQLLKIIKENENDIHQAENLAERILNKEIKNFKFEKEIF